MASDNKEKYTDKQKRKAEHIENSYEDKGVSHKKAEQIAWATVNKHSGGGEKSGSGRSTPSWKKDAARKDSAQRAAQTRHEKSDPFPLEDQPIEMLKAKARQMHISGRSTMNKEELIEALRKG